jgi:hypothetical protein
MNTHLLAPTEREPRAGSGGGRSSWTSTFISPNGPVGEGLGLNAQHRKIVHFDNRRWSVLYLQQCPAASYCASYSIRQSSVTPDLFLLRQYFFSQFIGFFLAAESQVCVELIETVQYWDFCSENTEEYPQKWFTEI